MGPGGPPMGPLNMQPPSIGGPFNGGGIPPTMQGQLEPEMMDLPPVGASQEFAALTGQGMTDAEVLAYLQQRGL